MNASLEELGREFDWSKSLPASVSRPKIFKCLSPEEKRLAGLNKWTSVLSQESLEFLLGCRKMFWSDKSKGFACMLNQNPETHAQISVGTDVALMTCVSNNPCMFVQLPEGDKGQEESRWFSPYGLLLLHGVVVLALVSAHGERASFCFPNSQRSRQSTIKQSGNTMHIHIMHRCRLFWRCFFDIHLVV